MLIGIDASRALRASRTGTERYALEIIHHLLHPCGGIDDVLLASVGERLYRIALLEDCFGHLRSIGEHLFFLDDAL